MISTVLRTCFDDAPAPAASWIERLVVAGVAVQEVVHEAIRTRGDLADLAGVDKSANEDTFRLDKIADDVVHQVVSTLPLASEQLHLIGEGVSGKFVKDDSAGPKDRYTVIIDPVDGTRMLMHNKRSAWFLAGVAPDLGQATTLADIFAAVMVELPTIYQVYGEVFAAVRGHGARRFRATIGGRDPLELATEPSRASDLRTGFAQVVNFFFPGPQALTGELMMRIGAAASGPIEPGRALVFHDQYISTGGMLAELIRGVDRLSVDLRPPLQKATKQHDTGLCCHPYDIAAAALVAQEAGVLLTDGFGKPLRVPLSPNDYPVHWIGYANRTLRQKIEPVIQQFLTDHGIADESFPKEENEK